MILGFLVASPCFGQEKIADLKLGLASIRAARESGQTLKENPLASSELSNYVSRNYLFYYRGLAHYLIAKGKQGEQKLENLEAALSDLKLSCQSPHPDKVWEQALLEVYKESIETAYALKRFFTVINFIEKLPPKDQTDAHWVLYYAQALFETHQTTAFLRLVKAYPSFFAVEDLALKHLPSPPRWQRLISIALQDSQDAKRATGAKQDTPPLFTKSSLLENPREAMTYLRKHYFYNEAEKTFASAAALYESVVDKGSPSPQEIRFVREFTRFMPALGPNWMERLIQKLWKRNKLHEAERLSLTFVKHHKSHPSFPSVLFDLGRIQEDSGEYREAIRSYEEFLQISDAEPLRELAKFRIAWVHHLAKKPLLREPKRAESLFGEYLTDYPDGRYASTSRFFKLMQLVQKTSLAETRDQALQFVEEHPLNFYSLMVLDNWELSGEFLLNRFSRRPLFQEIQYQQFKAKIAALSKLRTYTELRTLDLQDDAWKLLMTFPFDEGNESFMLFLAAEFSHLGYDHGRVLSMARILSSFPHLRNKLPWEGLFPAFKLELIKETLSEQASTLSPFLILAVIRQESAFNPEALSPAKAFGLMQLIEPTARISAKKLGLEEFDLLKAKDNLSLGIKTFSDLLEQFENRLDYALSAYNAGEAVTNQWVKWRGHLAPVEFIESIPYQETRNYVKNVLRNYAVYRLLYDSQAAPHIFFHNKPYQVSAR